MTKAKNLAAPDTSTWIAAVPIAHRGLHDAKAGTFENTLSAARAAAERGFAIEVDLHPSADGVPMIFHDHTLDRLTAAKGDTRSRTAAELGRFSIGGTADTIPTLRQLLEAVGGRVGLVLELKGADSPQDEPDHPHPEGLVESVARELEGYSGPVAVMSFDHRLVRDARRHFTTRPVGLTAWGDETTAGQHWRIAREAEVDFVSYGIGALPNSFVAEFRSGGKPVITWTIRNREQAEKSALYADQITFEGFDPRHA